MCAPCLHADTTLEAGGVKLYDANKKMNYENQKLE